MRIIDTDGGFDDLIAISYAVCHGIEISAITTVFGNTESSKACQNIFRLLKHLKCDIPIYIGAGQPLNGTYIEDIGFAGEDGLFGVKIPCDEVFKPDISAEEFYESLNAPFEIISLGPHTNIAKIKNPLLKKIKISSGYFNLMPVKEKRLAWNMRLDMEAARRVYNRGVEIDVVGLDATGDYVDNIFDDIMLTNNFFREALCFTRNKGYRDLTLISDALIFAEILESVRGKVIFKDREDSGFAALIPDKKGKVSVAKAIDLSRFLSTLRPLL